MEVMTTSYTAMVKLTKQQVRGYKPEKGSSIVKSRIVEAAPQQQSSLLISR